MLHGLVATNRRTPGRLQSCSASIGGRRTFCQATPGAHGTAYRWPEREIARSSVDFVELRAESINAQPTGLRRSPMRTALLADLPLDQSDRSFDMASLYRTPLHRATGRMHHREHFLDRLERDPRAAEIRGSCLVGPRRGVRRNCRDFNSALHQAMYGDQLLIACCLPPRNRPEV